MFKTEAYYINEIKKQKHKTQIRVSGHEYAYAYIGLHMQPSCMRTHSSSLRTHARSMCMHTHPENPRLKIRNIENKAKPKIIKLTT